MYRVFCVWELKTVWLQCGFGVRKEDVVWSCMRSLHSILGSGAQSFLGWTRTTLVKSQRMHAEGLCGDGEGREPVRKAGASSGERRCREVAKREILQTLRRFDPQNGCGRD